MSGSSITSVSSKKTDLSSALRSFSEADLSPSSDREREGEKRMLHFYFKWLSDVSDARQNEQESSRCCSDDDDE